MHRFYDYRRLERSLVSNACVSLLQVSEKSIGMQDTELCWMLAYNKYHVMYMQLISHEW